MENKLDFYNNNGVEEYYFYDPYKNNLQGWLRSNNNLKKIPNINGWVSPRLQITFRLTASTLEIYRPDGRKFLTSVELEERAELEKQRAEAEKLRADTEQQRAEDEKLRAEAEKLRADAEQQRADTERQMRLNAVTRLLSMGLSVEIVAQTLELKVEEVEKMNGS
jgi:flagellar biosynthesis GTPase FlhF